MASKCFVPTLDGIRPQGSSRSATLDPFGWSVGQAIGDQGTDVVAVGVDAVDLLAQFRYIGSIDHAVRCGLVELGRDPNGEPGIPLNGQTIDFGVDAFDLAVTDDRRFDV